MLSKFKLYRVGGCVRDKLLGVSSKDIDFTAVQDPKHYLETHPNTLSVDELFAELIHELRLQGFELFLITPDCYTIRAKFPPSSRNAGLVADFVLARKEEGYYPGTRKPILKPGTLYDDLVRRDFTLNALAEDEDGNIIDLFNGIWALEARMLITPLDARITMLDDPLRLLRAFRFSITKDFIISPRVWETCLMDSVVNKLEEVVSQERIREEVLKMMKHSTTRTLELLGEISKINPRLIEIMFSRGMWLKPTFEK